MLLAQIFDRQFSNISNYDCIVQITFREISDFVNFKNDPKYRELIMGDHDQFADTKKSL